MTSSPRSWRGNPTSVKREADPPDRVEDGGGQVAEPVAARPLELDQLVVLVGQVTEQLGGLTRAELAAGELRREGAPEPLAHRIVQPHGEAAIVHRAKARADSFRSACLPLPVHGAKAASMSPSCDQAKKTVASGGTSGTRWPMPAVDDIGTGRPALGEDDDLGPDDRAGHALESELRA